MKRACVAIFAASLTCACMTARVDMKYAPTDQPEPMRVARMPTLFVAAVDDRAGGFIYHGGGATRSGQLVDPLTDTVREAISLELKRAGVPLTAVRSSADAVLKAAVLAANEAIKEGANTPLTANLSLSLQLRSLVGDLLWSNEISGTGNRTVLAPGIPGLIPTLSMNDALAQAMSKMRRSLEEEGVLERVFRSPATSAVAVVPVAVRAPSAPVAPSSDIDALPPAVAPRPRSYAVVIGIEHYREKLPNADFAAGDAKLTAEYLKRTLGYPTQNIALLTDDHAAKGDFEKYFERWLPNHVQPGDEVFVYYSGHGAPNPMKGDAYLVPYDGDPAYLEQTGYPLKRLYEQLAKLPAKRVLVAMDACFSGAGGRSVLAQGARPLVSVVQNEVPSNLTVIAASASDQISNSYQEKGHGLFTYFLLKGLKEKGPDLKGVYDYLKPEVSRIARERYNADQDPQWRQGK